MSALSISNMPWFHRFQLFSLVGPLYSLIFYGTPVPGGVFFNMDPFFGLLLLNLNFPLFPPVLIALLSSFVQLPS